MQIIADLHLHSKYSLATSPECEPEGLAKWAKIKGVGLVGTGDFTHPKYLSELKGKLTESEGAGIYEYNGMKFILSCEVSTIYRQGDKTRKIHQILFTPSLDAAQAISDELGKYGKIASDGRPILKMSSAQLADLIFSLDRKNVIIPAHVWTPWFGLFGSKSGFDSIDECYAEHAKRIFALETGLSSDPAMNRRLSALDRFTLVSNSDTHSPEKLGREANVLDLQKLDYDSVFRAIKEGRDGGFVRTVEFFPQEGKYHVDGHRACGFSCSPKKTKELGGVCPKCGKPLTKGVEYRVEELADRPEGYQKPGDVPFVYQVPLKQLISSANGGIGEHTKKAGIVYGAFLKAFGTEFAALNATQKQLGEAQGLDQKTSRAISLVQSGKVKLVPGFDGEYGRIEVEP
ncbi:MAG: endonuclease Q family protein [Candidatus Micrarchaeia archaeon]